MKSLAPVRKSQSRESVQDHERKARVVREVGNGGNDHDRERDHDQGKEAKKKNQKDDQDRDHREDDALDHVQLIVCCVKNLQN